MNRTIVSETIVKICVFDIRISTIKSLTNESKININRYKTSKVGP